LTRLKEVIDRYVDTYKIVKRDGNEWTYSIQLDKLQTVESNTIIEAAKEAETKRDIFVAMPFGDDMIDTFEFGIYRPIKAISFKAIEFRCERMDKDVFTGDVLTRIKDKIGTCSVVVADLTQANPNVYLEVGYAWGIDKPTILIVKKGEEIKFDVQGQRCLIYKDILHLEDLLTKEIKGLIACGKIK